MQTVANVVADLERRQRDAERTGATAPLARVYADLLNELRPLASGDTAPAANANGTTWRERLWTAPPDTLLGVREVAEALGRPRSFVYRAVAAKRGPRRLAASRLDGLLVFEAGAVREWVKRWAEPA